LVDDPRYWLDLVGIISQHEQGPTLPTCATSPAVTKAKASIVGLAVQAVSQGAASFQGFLPANEHGYVYVM